METIVIAGGSGTVGTKLVSILMDKHEYNVLCLTRNLRKSIENEDFIHWDVNKGVVDPKIYTADHIINLSGAGIADKKWSKSRKKEIIESRTRSTSLLIETLRKKGKRIKSFINASAIGFYGNGGEKWLEEDDLPHTKEFLSDVCVSWEASATNAIEIAERVVIFRIGTVLSREAGALTKMDMTIPMGLANYFGTGKQYMSWIHIKDLCNMIAFALTADISGIFNAVSPEPVTNKSFMSVLRKVINPRSILVPVPKISLKLLLGEMSKLVLNSSRIKANKILNRGFKFEYPDLKGALEDLYDVTN